MADDLTDFLAAREPTAQRPLLGLTVLVVEDSRFACEAMRLLCLRSGARIRRADCLASARRHLMAYRPTVVVVDLGLPDGSGLDLIREIAARSPRVPALLATSGDGGAEKAALAAGADAFLPKPIESLSVFRSAVLGALPATPHPISTGRRDAEDRVTPDPLALRDDLAHAADMLDHRPAGEDLDYLAQFLSGVARSAHDAPLQAAAEALARERLAGRGTGTPVSRISGLVRHRLASGAAF
ncbi:response regulator [Defluviimonas sp. SAOS-178_SWC]|uniref:response regulator n=1 Tax=Defluviimonas sp. SAOS-178_SWC TaxID=3121287 RepID=UPI0032214427